MTDNESVQYELRWWIYAALRYLRFSEDPEEFSALHGRSLRLSRELDMMEAHLSAIDNRELIKESTDINRPRYRLVRSVILAFESGEDMTIIVPVDPENVGKKFPFGHLDDRVAAGD